MSLPGTDKVRRKNQGIHAWAIEQQDQWRLGLVSSEHPSGEPSGSLRTTACARLWSCASQRKW